MGPHGRNNGRDDQRLRLREVPEASTDERNTSEDPDLVFDFTGLQNPDLCGLSLVLTARLQASDGDRVWVRALPTHTWRVLRSLGLDHLFRAYPSAEVMH